MKIARIPLDRINPAPYNPREDLQPDDPDYIAIKKSIDKFGHVDPLVWNEKTGTLIGGHQRYKIIKAGGAAEAWCSVVRLDTEAEEKELNFALNRALGRWHLPRLETLVGELKSLDVDIAYLRPEELLSPSGGGTEVIEDDVPAVPQEPRSRRGEVYGLGEHRLMCGDATSEEDVSQLMDGEKADMVFTDPPYGIDYDDKRWDKIQRSHTGGKSKKFGKIQGDNIEFDAQYIFNFFRETRDVFLWGADNYCHSLLHGGSWIVWDRKLPQQEKVPYRDFELCWSKKRHKPTLFRLPWGGFQNKEKSEERLHPTQKPIALAAWFLGQWSKEGGLIVDLFGGSGSTLIACEQLGRRCRMMEIDPLYCDVIRDRYAKFVGRATPEAPEKPEIAAVPPLEAPEPKDTPPATKAPPAPTSAPQPPPERDLPEELGGGEHDVPLEGQVWTISAAEAALALNMSGLNTDCRDGSLWPPSSGRPEKEACHWLGPEGCTLKPQDKPVSCHLYPLGLDKSGMLHSRVRDDGVERSNEVLRNGLTAVFGDGVASAVLQSVRAGQDYQFPVPTEVAAALRRETKWARANAIPVPRTLFDDGNMAALKDMPRDKVEASMRCLDGKPSPKGAAEAAPKPAPVGGFIVRDVDEDGPPAIDSPGGSVGPVEMPTLEEVLEIAKKGGVEVNFEIPEDIASTGRKIQQAVASAVQEPTLEEVAAKDGIFEALQRSGPPRTSEPSDVVLDFITPVEAQTLPRGGTVYVKRDDLFSVAGVRGGKARTCWALATERPTKGLITAGSRMSPQCNIVAHIAHRLGVPCRLHIPASKQPLVGELAEAKALGAQIVEHRPGYNTVIVARAREDALEHIAWSHIPFGMECEEAVQQTRRQARILERYGRICERIVVPVEFGMSLAGILWGMKDAGALGALPVLGICIGGSDPHKRLDQWAPPRWREDVTLKNAMGNDRKPATRTRLGDLELDPGYEAKCLPHLKPKDLLWVVGIRNSVQEGRA